MTNTVLCDAQVTPDGAVVVIEDVGARGVPGVYIDERVGYVAPSQPVHAIWVRTMSMFDGELLGRGVRVRVLVGTEPRGLGDPVYRGELAIASGVVAIGEAHNPDRKLLVGLPAILKVTIFADTTIDAIHFDDPPADYPVSGPTDIAVLIHDNPGFAHAVPDRHRWGLRWPAAIRRAGQMIGANSLLSLAISCLGATVASIIVAAGVMNHSMTLPIIGVAMYLLTVVGIRKSLKARGTATPHTVLTID